MTKTVHDARKHIREWSAFFTEAGSAGKAAVEAFVKHGARRKYLKQTLERLIAKGYLRDENGTVKPTKKGLAFFRLHHLPVHQKNAFKEGKWYLLSFDIPVRWNSKRIALGRILKKYEFYPLQKSVWVGPHALAKDVWEFIVDQKLERCCTPMIVDILEGDAPLREHFRVG